MDIQELKMYSRPRRTPREGPLKILKNDEDLRGKDIRYNYRTYIVMKRSRTHPLTHWICESTTRHTKYDGELAPIELSEVEIREMRADMNARRFIASDTIRPSRATCARPR